MQLYPVPTAVTTTELPNRMNLLSGEVFLLSGVHCKSNADIRVSFMLNP